MQVIKVDVVGAQALEARFDGGGDILARAARARLHRQAELGGKNDLLAFVAHHLTHEVFGHPIAAINIGGIEVIDAGIDRMMDHAARRLDVGARAEVVAADPQHGELEVRVAQCPILHVRSVPFSSKGY